MGRLCQGVGKGKNGLGNRVEGTNNSYVIRFEDIPKDRLNKICYNSVLCQVIPVKKDPNFTQITIFGTNVCYPGDVGTNTESLELFNIMINSILSLTGGGYVCFDIETFTLAHHLLDQITSKFNCPIFPKNSSNNTTSPYLHTKVGYILKSVVDATD